MSEPHLAALSKELKQLGAECRPAGPGRDDAIDGRLPALYCRPGSPEQVAAVLAAAGRHGAAVIPRGEGTKLGLGAPPRRADVLLALAGLNAIGDYSPADLTVTCQAGARWAGLQADVGAQGQMVPLDPPFRDRTTAGGVVAANASGPSRAGYGSARDYLIGVQVANADGTISKAGGKVVKNVAGYDLNKLYTGSLGTVGIILETTWKLLPLPAMSATVLFALDGWASGTQIALQIVRAGLQPRAAQIFDRKAMRRVLATAPSLEVRPTSGRPVFGAGRACAAAGWRCRAYRPGGRGTAYRAAGRPGGERLLGPDQRMARGSCRGPARRRAV